MPILSLVVNKPKAPSRATIWDSGYDCGRYDKSPTSPYELGTTEHETWLSGFIRGQADLIEYIHNWHGAVA